jgi:hypothetical protein
MRSAVSVTDPIEAAGPEAEHVKERDPINGIARRRKRIQRIRPLGSGYSDGVASADRGKRADTFEIAPNTPALNTGR